MNGIKADFKGIYGETFCPLGCGENDTLENILRCKTILSNYRTTQLCNGNSNYNDVFSKDIRKQKEVTELYRKFLEIRNKLISEQTSGLTGPMHCINV